MKKIILTISLLFFTTQKANANIAHLIKGICDLFIGTSNIIKENKTKQIITRQSLKNIKKNSSKKNNNLDKASINTSAE